MGINSVAGNFALLSSFFGNSVSCIPGCFWTLRCPGERAWTSDLPASTAQVVGIQACTQMSWGWARGLLQARQAFCHLSPSLNLTFSVVIFVLRKDEECDSNDCGNDFFCKISVPPPKKKPQTHRKWQRVSDTFRMFSWQTVGYRGGTLFFISFYTFPQMLVLRKGQKRILEIWKPTWWELYWFYWSLPGR